METGTIPESELPKCNGSFSMRSASGAVQSRNQDKVTPGPEQAQSILHLSRHSERANSGRPSAIKQAAQPRKHPREHEPSVRSSRARHITHVLHLENKTHAHTRARALQANVNICCAHSPQCQLHARCATLTMHEMHEAELQRCVHAKDGRASGVSFAPVLRAPYTRKDDRGILPCDDAARCQSPVEAPSALPHRRRGPLPPPEQRLAAGWLMRACGPV
ncbi:hypothetical protein MHYP_G00076000 [Metynnis hypsauchen]